MAQGAFFRNPETQRVKKVPARGPISTRFEIVIINLESKTETRSSVLSQVDGVEVTEDMLKHEVGVLNSICGRHGRTGHPVKRLVAFRLETLQ